MNRRRGVDDESSDEESAADLKSQTHAGEDDVATDTVSQPVNRDGDDDSAPSDEEQGDAASERDSSEESSDEDEDELARVQEGFVASSEDDEDGDNSGKKRRHKRRRRQRSSEENLELDEDDLDLLGLAQGSRSGSGDGDETSGSHRFKRLKRAQSDKKAKGRGLDAMFDDESEAENSAGEQSGEDDEGEAARQGSSRAHRGGEFDDFIEADEFGDDEDEAMRREEEREIGRRRAGRGAASRARQDMGGLAAVGDLAGLDEEKLSEIYDVFGDGEMYNWALANEDEEAADGAAHPPQPEELQLTDVFEPSELAARMLTSEDNQIRSEDLPERYQLSRSKLRHAYDLTDENEYSEKKQWIADKLLASRNETPLLEATRKAIHDVIDSMARQHLEVPFIWHHRQDFLVHFSSKDSSAERTQLLTLNDLWQIVDLDMDFHSLIERRRALAKLQASVDVTNSSNNADLSQLSSLGQNARTGVEYQDLVDYVHFAASSQLRAARRHSRFANFDRVRSGPTMELVDAVNIDLEKVASTLALQSKTYPPTLPSRAEIFGTRDSALTPKELADELGPAANIEDAVNFISYALSVEPRVRRFFRSQFEHSARIDLVVTDDGKRKITENSPFADLKYSANWTLDELRSRPALFLRMLKAEEQGLLIVRMQYPQYKSSLYASFDNMLAGQADNAEVDSWAASRQKIAKSTSRLVVPLVARNVLESLRSSSVRALRYDLRNAFADRLDQAPYKPPGYVLGTTPRVLCLSAGEVGFSDAVLGAILDEDGHVSEVVKIGDARTQTFREKLVQVVKDTRPDVVGVAGFTPAARRLHDNVHNVIVDDAKLTSGPEDAEQPLAVIWVQDEVARLYRNSERASIEFPDLVPNARYCVAVARYLQSPVLEYAQLDAGQLRNLLLHPDQQLLPDDDFTWAVETAFVDSVCDQGVDINVAVRSAYHAALLPYVAGLGPRKASSMLQLILARAKSGQLASRTQLVTSEITSRIVFMNCASFLKIPWSSTGGDSDSGDSEYLDMTRVHPEDYELARKMCADALELDEEDVEAIEDRQVGGVVGKLIEEDPEGYKLDELVLEEYAEELEQLFEQRKRITLDQIRREIQDPYRERRRTLIVLSPAQIFTMLTGETAKSFHRGSVVSGTVTRVTGRQLVLSLNGGIDGVADTGNISDDRSVNLSQQFAPGQAVPAEVLSVDYGALFARVNTRASAVAEAQKRLTYESRQSLDAAHWNSEAERRDYDNANRRAEQKQRQMRVIKHPLFRPFSAREAEAYLAPLQRGDLVIRPSSRGMDHLVVTWKVADQIYQHIDVLEQDKPNDYAVGRSLLVGPYRYSDLDELIIMHVQSMAHKVDELTASEKFQKGNRHDVERWLSAYTNARPTQSVYAYCFDHRRPGYFLLCYQLGANQPIKDIHVKVLPNGYELMRNAYPDVQSLSNGFKMLVQRSRV